MTETIDGATFKEMILHGAASVTLCRQQINDLNVFPVPDGDTGTNMSLTIGAAAEELKKTGPKTVGDAARVTSGALLRGARGNSGVILSLLFRGMSQTFKGRETADGALLAQAMQAGVEAAYGAVMKPAEGTVLTVSRLAAKRALEAAGENNDAQFVLSEALREGQEILPQTTEMNPTLKKAGVVDAGAKGYLVILEGMLAALRGEPLPEVDVDAGAERKADFAALADDEITYAFDTVFTVRRKGERSLEPLREYLTGIGDSLVIGEDDGVFKVHVHTDHPGLALEEAGRFGTLELAKIENMRTQRDELAAGQKAQSTDDLDALEEDGGLPCQVPPPDAAAEDKPCGFLAVCAGKGVEAVFRDLGVDSVVSGGQTMNPSTESILREIERTPGETVFVLPNNRNIIMAAQQCVGLSRKQVMVIPTETIPQGVAAMMAADPDMEPEEVFSAMSGAMAGVDTALIASAARRSEFDGFDIKKGDYLALFNGKLFATDHDMKKLLAGLADKAAGKGAEFITVFCGADVSDGMAQKARSIFAARCPGAELNVLPGGQPVYCFIIGIE